MREDLTYDCHGAGKKGCGLREGRKSPEKLLVSSEVVEHRYRILKKKLIKVTVRRTEMNIVRGGGRQDYRATSPCETPQKRKEGVIFPGSLPSLLFRPPVLYYFIFFSPKRDFNRLDFSGTEKQTAERRRRRGVAVSFNGRVDGKMGSPPPPLSPQVPPTVLVYVCVFLHSATKLTHKVQEEGEKK